MLPGTHSSCCSETLTPTFILGPPRFIPASDEKQGVGLGTRLKLGSSMSQHCAAAPCHRKSRSKENLLWRQNKSNMHIPWILQKLLQIYSSFQMLHIPWIFMETVSLIPRPCRRNRLASSNCYFYCQRVGRTNQISEHRHMTELCRVDCCSHAHSSQYSIALV